MKIRYPVRARIVDVTGGYLGDIPMRTPPVSIPHIGEEGLAEMVDGSVRITLDSGAVLWGYECWWVPVEEG